jgi:hypothetical protein
VRCDCHTKTQALKIGIPGFQIFPVVRRPAVKNRMCRPVREYEESAGIVYGNMLQLRFKKLGIMVPGHVKRKGAPALAQRRFAPRPSAQQYKTEQPTRNNTVRGRFSTVEGDPVGPPAVARKAVSGATAAPVAENPATICVIAAHGACACAACVAYNMKTNRNCRCRAV